MASEQLFTPGVVPSDIERESLGHLIDRSIEDNDRQSNTPNDSLIAMIDVSFRYGLMMSPLLKNHLRKMIVIHYELVSEPNAKTKEVLENSFMISMGKELSEFRGFQEDLSNMTEPWRAAMQDVLTPINDDKQGLIE